MSSVHLWKPNLADVNANRVGIGGLCRCADAPVKSAQMGDKKEKGKKVDLSQVTVMDQMLSCSERVVIDETESDSQLRLRSDGRFSQYFGSS